jgi:hypothetical protein
VGDFREQVQHNALCLCIVLLFNLFFFLLLFIHLL